MKSLKNSSTKCLQGVLKLSRNSKHRAEDPSSLSRNTRPKPQPKPEPQAHHRRVQQQSPVVLQQRLHSQRNEPRQRLKDSCQTCQECGQLFPLRTMKAHKDQCQQHFRRGEKRAPKADRREGTSKSKNGCLSKPKRKEEILHRKEIKKQTRKKISYQNRLPQHPRPEVPRPRQHTNLSSVHPLARPCSNRVRNHNVIRSRQRPTRRTRSIIRVNGMFPISVFQEMSRIPQMINEELLDLGGLGNQFANLIWSATNMINVYIPRRRRAVWYESEGMEESLSEVYFDNVPDYNQQGLDPDEIEDIPVYRFRRTEQSMNCQTTSKSCAICLSDFRNGQAIKLLQCEHNYHQECIDRWLQLKGTCPVCRNDLH